MGNTDNGIRAKKAAAVLPALLTALLALTAFSPAAELRALVVTGQNSHNWEQSSRALAKCLDMEGLFKTDIAVSPSKGEDMGAFLPDFKAYDCVVLDYQGDPWSPKMKEAFVDYVRSGGGLVVYHNSSNAFWDWEEYSTIIGLAGHRGPEIGPYVFWEDEGPAYDPSPGKSLHHGPVHAFPVITRVKDHPITRGLPKQWMHAPDELYCLLRGPRENLTLLATAYADPAMRGTGRHEPVLFTKTYGSGRIFHTALGHLTDDPVAMECVGFIVTLRRGAEWAATGDVTQPIPGDFPASPGGWPTDIRLWPDFQPPSLDAILNKIFALTKIEYSEAPAELRDYVLSHKRSITDRAACEARLTAFLSGRATAQAKALVCRQLRLIGSEASVPILAKFLRDPALSDAARFALEDIPGEKADMALLSALEGSRGAHRLGIISTLGQRRYAGAVGSLSRLAGGRDRPAAEAAIQALGRMGSSAAARALANIIGRSSSLAPTAAAALVGCAEMLASSGDGDEAAALCRRLVSSAVPVQIRQAAFRTLIASVQEKAALILETLKAGDESLFQPAIDLVPSVFSTAGVDALCKILPTLPEKAKIQLLAALKAFPSDRVRESAEAARGPEAVAVEALHVLAVLGNKASLPLILSRAAAAGKAQEAARMALAAMKDKAVDEALVLQVIKSEEPGIQEEAIRALGERRAGIGIPMLLDRARSPQPGIKRAALRALRDLAGPEHIPSLIDLLLQADNDRDRTEISRAAGAAAAKLPPGSPRAGLVVRRYDSVKTPQGRAALLGLLSHLGDNRSLALLRREMKAEDPALREAALRALAAWPDSSPRFDLMEAAKSTENATHKILALRAFIRMVEMDIYQAPQGAAFSLSEALSLAARPEEKKLILGILPKFPCMESLDLAESLAADQSVKAEAEEALKKIREALGK